MLVSTHLQYKWLRMRSSLPVTTHKRCSLPVPRGAANGINEKTKKIQNAGGARALKKK
jgi:hypothetical protein